MAGAVAMGVFGLGCITIAVVWILVSTRRRPKPGRRSPSTRRPPNPPWMPPY
ncbi:MAG: hypothetical protein ACJ76P_11250 [Actinomycetota bacterium]